MGLLQFIGPEKFSFEPANPHKSLFAMKAFSTYERYNTMTGSSTQKLGISLDETWFGLLYLVICSP
jgi:hypothetical protein